MLGNPQGTAYPTFEGTAPPFDLKDFTLAGKTGTASAAHQGQEPTAWFISFGPEPDPKYLVLVVVDQGGYGVSAAAPAVKAIFQYLQTNPIGGPRGVTPPTGQPATPLHHRPAGQPRRPGPPPRHRPGRSPTTPAALPQARPDHHPTVGPGGPGSLD